MSDTADKRHLKCKFGLINLAGLMPMRNKVGEDGSPLSSEILVPLFSHESYKIKTTFNTNLTYFGTSQTLSTDFAKMWFDYPDANNRNHYQKKFRREVLWDFGDGTQVQGYNVEHSYKKPGRYKITCTFFDINRRGWVNDFCIYVIVKEVIPTMLRFDKNNTKKSIKCSKIERLTRLESLISNTVDRELNVSVKRIFSKEEHEYGYEEIGRSYDEIPKNEFFHMEKYWCTLKNTQTLFYNSNQIYTSELTPTSTYTPTYNKLYCKFFYDEDNKESAPIGLSFYQIIPYKNIDDNLKTITVINPYSKIIDKEERKEYNITQVYSEDQLPEGVTYCGMRGWVDIFYKNDFIGSNNTLSFFHDIENENITGELISSPNYLNINPLGLSFTVIGNDKNEIRMAISSNSFLKPMELGAKLSDANIFIDQHLRNSLYKGLDINCYIFPYVIYKDDEVKVMNDSYYIPKDISLSLRYSKMIDKKYGFPSEVNTSPTAEPIYPWMYCVPLILRNYIDIIFNVETNNEKNFKIRLTQKPLQNPSKITIPQEKTTKVDIDRLLDAYMCHPLFKDKPNIREMLKIYVGGFVERIITEGNNFLDNTANIRTCYLSNLLTMLKMMGQEVTEYEYTSLEGINDLKKLARLLSINHSDLVGHVIDVDYDITINKDNKGVNVGDLIDLDDILTLNTEKPADNEPNKKDNYGKIQYVQIGSNKHKVNIEDGVDLIIHDKYTNDTRIVNFRSQLKHEEKETVTIGEYEPYWGWNLLLPDGFITLKEKIDLYTAKLDNDGYGSDQITFFNNEIKRLKNARKELIRSYYDFYLLNPDKDDLRIGNFIRSEDITEKIESLKEWESVWGITHDFLMKSMIENGGLKNNRDYGSDDFDYEGDEIWKSEYFNISKYFNKEGDINISFDENSYDYSSIQGEINIRGEILGEGSNPLYVTLKDGLLDYVDEFWIDGNELICYVSGNSLSGSGVFDIISNTFNETQIVSGKITIDLSGSIQNPVVTITVSDFRYTPNNLEVEISIPDNKFDGSFIHNGEIKPYEGKLNVEGVITGSGSNLLEFSLSDFIVYRTEKEIIDGVEHEFLIGVEENITIKKGDSVIINVNEDGTITEKEHTITIGGVLGDKNGNLTMTGTIVVKISGDIKSPVIEILSSNVNVSVILPDLDGEYNVINSVIGLNSDYSIIDGDTIIQSSIDGQISVPTYFENGSELRLRRKTDGWELYINALIYSKQYKPKSDQYGWQMYERIQGSFDINIDNFGNIVDGDGNIATTSIVIPFIYGTTLNKPSLVLTLSGNVVDDTVTCQISLSENPRGMYVLLFDVNETYATVQSYENVIFKGLDEYDQVRLFFTDKPLLFTSPTSISEYNKEVKLQIIKNEKYGDNEEQLILYDMTFNVSNIPITINEEGLIVHDDFILNEDYSANGQDFYETLNVDVLISGGSNQSVKSLKIVRSNEQKLNYSWKQDFSDLEGKYPYNVTMTINGYIFEDELKENQPFVNLTFKVNGVLGSIECNYSESRKVYLNNDGSIQQPQDFICILTNDVESEKIYEAFNLQCFVTVQGDYKNFNVVPKVEAVKVEDNILIEYDNHGNLTNCSLRKLEDGYSMFENQSKITNFNYSTGRLIIGDSMFNGCNNLVSFASSLQSLKSGKDMFNGCELDRDSIISIADTINDISKLDKENAENWTYSFDDNVREIDEQSRGRIDISYDSSIEQETLSISANEMIKKGWNVYFNGILQIYDERYEPEAIKCDITTESGYIPDASKWNEEIYIPNKKYIKIVRVIDGVAYND